MPRMPVRGMLGLVVALLLLTSESEGRRGGESCPGGRALGDKWFDGCHWCVCSVRGVRCSRSECSSEWSVYWLRGREIYCWGIMLSLPLVVLVVVVVMMMRARACVCVM